MSDNNVREGKIEEITPDPHNANKGTQAGLRALDKSLRELGAGRSILVDKNKTLIAGEKTTYRAADIGIEDVIFVPTDGTKLVAVQRTDLDLETDEGARQLAYADNRIAELDLEWDYEQVDFDLEQGVDLEWLGFDFEQEPEPDPGAQIDRAEELREKWGVESGQLWRLGEHRLICGDCTDAEVVARVMEGERARLIFTDPPYGIGKEIINDDLKREDWVDFYLAFTSVMLDHLIENGYFYVWGYFETLSDYWQEIIKPRGDCNFRNFIIWKKTFIQGQKAEDFRQYPEHYAACLLVIYGMPFQNGPWSVSPNAEFYPEIFEPIRAYLDGERKKMGWDIPTVKAMVGHSDLLRDHWFGRSQWTMPTREVYETLQENAKNDAFRKEYDELRKEYDELRGHFDNSFGFTDVWEFDELTLTDLHPTVKPVEVCERGIMTNSKDGELVLDVFLGSGSSLIACERLGRKCRAVEISPAYCAVAIQRWVDMTSGEPELVNS